MYLELEQVSTKTALGSLETNNMCIRDRYAARMFVCKIITFWVRVLSKIPIKLNTNLTF